jgi:hypothetical protein
LANVVAWFVPPPPPHAAESNALDCAFHLIAVLAEDDAGRQKLGGAGACEAVVGAAAEGSAPAKSREWLYRAITRLANDNSANAAKLVSAGACEAVAGVIAASVGDRHTQGAAATAAACEALALLARSEPGALERLQRAGAALAGLVRAALKAHAGNNRVREEGNRALRVLTGKEELEALLLWALNQVLRALNKFLTLPM